MSEMVTIPREVVERALEAFDLDTATAEDGLCEPLSGRMNTAMEALRAALAAGEARPTFMGMPVVVDPSMPPGEIKFVAAPPPPAEQPQPDAYNRKLRQQLEAEWASLQALKRAEKYAPQPAEPVVTEKMVRAAEAASEQAFKEYEAAHQTGGSWKECRDYMLRAALVAAMGVRK